MLTSGPPTRHDLSLTASTAERDATVTNSVEKETHAYVAFAHFDSYILRLLLAVLAVSPSGGINILRGTTWVLGALQENVPAIRSFLTGKERILQDIVDAALVQGVWITHVRRLRGQELIEALPSIRLAALAALSPKEREHAAAVAKVLAKHKRLYLLLSLADLEPSHRTFSFLLPFTVYHPPIVG
ncbi:hypothetical protein H4582DRAFT_2133706 [Lactarius indigo]|nr:hypothetical protein H4582DRAFT_2133706 [Lactarius indigo]